MYLIVLPAAIAWDVWNTWQACEGHPCGIYQDTALKSPNKSRPHINLGRAYLLHGRADLALREYQQADLVSLEETEPTRSYAQILVATNISDLFMRTGRMEEGHEILKEAWLKHPHAPSLAFNLSSYYLTRKPPEPEKALAFLDDALAHQDEFHVTDWDRGRLYWNRAASYQLLGRCAEKHEDFMRMRRLPEVSQIQEWECP